MEDKLKELKVVKEKLKAAVAPFWKDEMKPKQKLELAHCAKFIVSFDESIRIVEPRDAPDFIIEHQGRQIGLEIARLFNKEEVKAIKSREAIFDKAATVFKDKYPEESVLANVWTQENYQFSGDEVEEIADYIYQVKTGGEAARPAYIIDLLLLPHSGVSISYNEGGYSQAEMPATSLDEAIGKKEEKYGSYVKNTGNEVQWLLIVSSGIGSDAFDLEDYEVEKEYDSQFEHIYLLQDFQAAVITIK